MKLFVDANILISVLNKEYPLFSSTARILSMAGHRGTQIFTTPVCLAIAFYFAEKKHRTAMAKEKIALLCQHIQIAAVTANCVQQALADKRVHDFEDGVQYYAALQQGCDCIVTENTDDYYFADIQVLNSSAFLKEFKWQIG
jgi:predicted nucleic acid-binding protein